MYNDIVESIGKKESVMVVLLDLIGAFDTIEQTILIDSLKTNNHIRGNNLQWFKEYLYNRLVCVIIDGMISGESNLMHGFHQGLVFGTFTLYHVYYIFM